MASKDFIVKNGLLVGGSSATGGISAANASFFSSVSAAALSGVGTALTTNFTISAGGDVDDVTRNITALNGTFTLPLELKNTGVTANTYGSSTAIPAITIDEDGRITAASTNTISTDLTIAADSGSNDTVSLLSDTLTFAGTSNEIETTVSDNQIQIGLPDNVTLGGDLTLNGNDIKSNGGTTAITLATADVAIAGDLTVTGNDIKDSGANTVLTFDGSGNTTIGGNLTVNGTTTTINTTVTATTSAIENNFVITSTDDDASAAPDLKLYRNSSTPAANDQIGNILFTGRNAAPEDINYASILGDILDTTDGAEEGLLRIGSITGGSINYPIALRQGRLGVGTVTPNEKLTVAGNLSASGTIYADAFQSVTGGSTIGFNDNIDLAGTFTFSSGLNAGTTNSVVIEDSGVLQKRTINSRVWGGTLIDGSGTANRLTKWSDTDTVTDANISDDGSNVIVGVGSTTLLVDDDGTAGSIQFNNNKSAYHSVSASIANSASAALISIPLASYRTGKFVVQAVGAGGSSSHVESTEILMVHDGTDAYTTEYGTIKSGSDIGTYTAVVASGNVELRATNSLGATATFVLAVQHLMA